jgi:hypothetical protein
VDRDERFGNLDDPHVIRHDRAHAHGEVGVVYSRHVVAAEDILADLGSLFRRQVDRALLALGLALTLVSALLVLVLRVALLSLALLGLALTLVPAFLALVLRIALLSLALLGFALTLVPALFALVLRITVTLALPVALRRLTGRVIPRRLVFLRLLRLSGAFRLPVVRRLS